MAVKKNTGNHKPNNWLAESNNNTCTATAPPNGGNKIVSSVHVGEQQSKTISVFKCWRLPLSIIACPIEGYSDGSSQKQFKSENNMLSGEGTNHFDPSAELLSSCIYAYTQAASQFTKSGRKDNQSTEVAVVGNRAHDPWQRGLCYHDSHLLDGQVSAIETENLASGFMVAKSGSIDNFMVNLASCFIGNHKQVSSRTQSQ